VLRRFGLGLAERGALRRFVSLPYHVEIMRRYRSRGSLRAVDWQADTFDLRAAFDHGQRVDEGKGRQRGGPRPRVNLVR
jgi:hypothetical protein